jgi:hypothetical protein
LQGRQEGRQEMMRRILEKRFGRIPDWAETRLLNLPAVELDEVAVRSLDASSFEELFAGT